MEVSDREEVSQLVAIINAKTANGKYDKKTIEALKMAVEHIENYESIDQALVQTLKDLLGAESLHERDSYDNVVKSLEEGSVLVYFKSAQLFKAYKKDDVDKLLSGQLRTIYKHLATSYEIVPNSAKQKIIILAELSLEQHLNRIKQYIIAFMNEHGDVKLKSDDIVCFKNQEAETVEIVINNYYVENSSERDEIIKSLLEYIGEKEKNNQMTRKMGFQNTPVFKDASMISVPSGKQQIMSLNPNYIEFVDLLISNIRECLPIVRNGTNITVQIGNLAIGNNNNVGNVANTTHNTTIIEEVAPNDEDLINVFADNIKTNKPEWFKEGEWIDKSILLQKFIEMFDRTPKVFYGMIQNRLFTKEKRARDSSRKGGRAQQVKLVNFTEI